ncbi:hypothetical protein [Streptomyces sp. MH60]|uniref:hypothetical protein n=1 Tax=Streptomyces sp. MH60 TaxID=1940758 RepID=UPI000CEEC0A4|nr:hypothetical protein [Streptomyces sp. MH60]PPS86456.1 hypothetical protein BZZ08_03423 [Streptomyces sp. MH60]
MARHTGDDTETFRAVLEYEQPKPNPEYHYRHRRDVPQFLDEWEPRTSYMGPYSTRGAARAQMSRHRRETLWDGARLIREYVQRSPLTWEDVT